MLQAESGEGRREVLIAEDLISYIGWPHSTVFHPGTTPDPPSVG